MSAEGVTAADNLLNSIQARSLEGAIAAMHPDVVVHEAESLPYGGDWKGREGFAKLLEKMMGTFDIAINDFETFDPGPDSDRVLMRAEATFTVHSSGESLRTEIVEIYTVKDGLIIDADIFPKDAAAIANLAARAGM